MQDPDWRSSEKFKLLKFGLTRGYEYDQLAPVVAELLKDMEIINYQE